MSLFSEMMRRKRAARENALQTVLTNVTCDTLPPPQLPNTPRTHPQLRVRFAVERVADNISAAGSLSAANTIFPFLCVSTSLSPCWPSGRQAKQSLQRRISRLTAKRRGERNTSSSPRARKITRASSRSTRATRTTSSRSALARSSSAYRRTTTMGCSPAFRASR